jgi:type III restriction enzyme
MQYDIVIPSTDFSYNRLYKKIAEIDPLNFPSLFSSDKLSEERKVLLKMEMMNLGVEVHQAEIQAEYLELGQDLIAHITNEVMKKAKLTDCFNILYPKVEYFITDRCFERKIPDVENEELRKKLREISIQEIISDLLATEIGKSTVEKKKITVEGNPLKLSDTPKFTWRRKHLKCKKTVFNFAAVYNDYEAEFAQFLDRCDDIEAFAALADIFRIDYLTSKGAIRYYFPDFIAVQKKKSSKIYWMLETKGREYPELENKNKAIERWCSSVTKQTGREWKYLMVKQAFFNAIKDKGKSFEIVLSSKESSLV